MNMEKQVMATFSPLFWRSVNNKTFDWNFILRVNSNRSGCHLQAVIYYKTNWVFDRIYINNFYQQRRMPRMSVFPIREASLWDREALLG